MIYIYKFITPILLSCILFLYFIISFIGFILLLRPFILQLYRGCFLINRILFRTDFCFLTLIADLKSLFFRLIPLMKNNKIHINFIKIILVYMNKEIFVVIKIIFYIY